MKLDQALDEGQAQAEPAPSTVKGLPPLHEDIENGRQSVGLDTETGISDPQDTVAALGGDDQLDTSSRRRELQRVIEKIRNHLLDSHRINVDGDRFPFYGHGVLGGLS